MVLPAAALTEALVHQVDDTDIALAELVREGSGRSSGSGSCVARRECLMSVDLYLSFLALGLVLLALHFALSSPVVSQIAVWGAVVCFVVCGVLATKKIGS